MTGVDLKAWRERVGLTQALAADALGVHEKTVMRAEASASESLSPRVARGLIARLALESGPIPERAPAPEILELHETLRRADNAAEFAEVAKRVAIEASIGRLNAKAAALMLDACRVTREVLKVRALEKARHALESVEVMTLDEVEALRQLRESRTPRALAPRECAAPPETGRANA